MRFVVVHESEKRRVHGANPAHQCLIGAPRTGIAAPQDAITGAPPIANRTSRQRVFVALREERIEPAAEPGVGADTAVGAKRRGSITRRLQIFGQYLVSRRQHPTLIGRPMRDGEHPGE